MVFPYADGRTTSSDLATTTSNHLVEATSTETDDRSAILVSIHVTLSTSFVMNGDNDATTTSEPKKLNYNSPWWWWWWTSTWSSSSSKDTTDINDAVYQSTQQHDQKNNRSTQQQQQQQLDYWTLRRHWTVTFDAVDDQQQQRPDRTTMESSSSSLAQPQSKDDDDCNQIRCFVEQTIERDSVRWIWNPFSDNDDDNASSAWTGTTVKALNYFIPVHNDSINMKDDSTTITSSRTAMVTLWEVVGTLEPQQQGNDNEENKKKNNGSINNVHYHHHHYRRTPLMSRVLHLSPTSSSVINVDLTAPHQSVIISLITNKSNGFSFGIVLIVRIVQWILFSGLVLVMIYTLIGAIAYWMEGDGELHIEIEPRTAYDTNNTTTLSSSTSDNDSAMDVVAGGDVTTTTSTTTTTTTTPHGNNDNNNNNNNRCSMMTIEELRRRIEHKLGCSNNTVIDNNYPSTTTTQEQDEEEDSNYEDNVAWDDIWTNWEDNNNNEGSEEEEEGDDDDDDGLGGNKVYWWEQCIQDETEGDDDDDENLIVKPSNNHSSTNEYITGSNNEPTTFSSSSDDDGEQPVNNDDEDDDEWFPPSVARMCDERIMGEFVRTMDHLELTTTTMSTIPPPSTEQQQHPSQQHPREVSSHGDSDPDGKTSTTFSAPHQGTTTTTHFPFSAADADVAATAASHNTNTGTVPDLPYFSQKQMPHATTTTTSPRDSPNLSLFSKQREVLSHYYTNDHHREDDSNINTWMSSHESSLWPLTAASTTSTQHPAVGPAADSLTFGLDSSYANPSLLSNQQENGMVFHASEDSEHMRDNAALDDTMDSCSGNPPNEEATASSSVGLARHPMVEEVTGIGSSIHGVHFEKHGSSVALGTEASMSWETLASYKGNEENDTASALADFSENTAAAVLDKEDQDGRAELSPEMAGLVSVPFIGSPGQDDVEVSALDCKGTIGRVAPEDSGTCSKELFPQENELMDTPIGYSLRESDFVLPSLEESDDAHTSVLLESTSLNPSVPSAEDRQTPNLFPPTEPDPDDDGHIHPDKNELIPEVRCVNHAIVVEQPDGLRNGFTTPSNLLPYDRPENEVRTSSTSCSAQDTDHKETVAFLPASSSEEEVDSLVREPPLNVQLTPLQYDVIAPIEETSEAQLSATTKAKMAGGPFRHPIDSPCEANRSSDDNAGCEMLVPHEKNSTMSSLCVSHDWEVTTVFASERIHSSSTAEQEWKSPCEASTCKKTEVLIAEHTAEEDKSQQSTGDIGSVITDMKPSMHPDREGHTPMFSLSNKVVQAVSASPRLQASEPEAVATTGEKSGDNHHNSSDKPENEALIPFELADRATIVTTNEEKLNSTCLEKGSTAMLGSPKSGVTILNHPRPSAKTCSLAPQNVTVTNGNAPVFGSEQSTLNRPHRMQFSVGTMGRRHGFAEERNRALLEEDTFTFGKQNIAEQHVVGSSKSNTTTNIGTKHRTDDSIGSSYVSTLPPDSTCTKSTRDSVHTADLKQQQQADEAKILPPIVVSTRFPRLQETKELARAARKSEDRTLNDPSSHDVEQPLGLSPKMSTRSSRLRNKAAALPGSKCDASFVVDDSNLDNVGRLPTGLSPLEANRSYVQRDTEDPAFAASMTATTMISPSRGNPTTTLSSTHTSAATKATKQCQKHETKSKVGGPATRFVADKHILKPSYLTVNVFDDGDDDVVYIGGRRLPEPVVPEPVLSASLLAAIAAVEEDTCWIYKEEEATTPAATTTRNATTTTATSHEAAEQSNGRRRRRGRPVPSVIEMKQKEKRQRRL